MTPKKKVRKPIAIVVISPIYSNQEVLAERLARDLFFDYINLDAPAKAPSATLEFPGVVLGSSSDDEKKIFLKPDITFYLVAEGMPDPKPSECWICTEGLTADEVYVQILRVCARTFAEMVAKE